MSANSSAILNFLARILVWKVSTVYIVSEGDRIITNNFPHCDKPVALGHVEFPSLRPAESGKLCFEIGVRYRQVSW